MSKYKSILFSYNFKLLYLAIAWQIAYTLIGHFFDFYKGGLIAHTSYWDGGWYQEITNFGYSRNPAAPVFFPLFPLLVNIIKFVTFDLINTLYIGLFINTLTLWLSWVALSKIINITGFKKANKLVILLFMLAPGAFFMHMYYTEALFCALGFWAYYLALKNKWLPMAIILALISATRITSLLFIFLCAAVYAQRYSWNVKKMFNKNLLYFFITPLGFIAYGLYLIHIKGDFFYMLKALDANTDWAYHVFNPNVFSTIYNNIKDSVLILTGVKDIYYDGIVKIIIPTISILTLLGSTIYALLHKNRKIFLPLGLFGLASVVFLSLNSNLISVHRYILPEIILYIVAVDILYKKSKLKPVVYVLAVLSVLVQITLSVLFVRMWFVG